jgi:hypothetical protein
MTKKDRLDYIKDALEQLYSDLEDINNDVDEIYETPINKIDDVLYGKDGICYTLQKAIDYLYTIQQDVDALYEDEDD